MTSKYSASALLRANAHGLAPVKRPTDTATFEEYLNYYLERKNWSQSKLAACSRISQPQINRIINGKINNIEVDILICICLALQLNKNESVDLLARASRAISPASPCYHAYYELIGIYSKKKIVSDKIDDFLSDADEYLKQRKLPRLPSHKK